MRLKDMLSPERWRSYYIYLVREHLIWLDQSDWTPEVHEIEQFMYRYLRCAECLEKGKCINCRCKIPERMHVRSDSCSAGRWFPIKEKEEWNRFKKVKGIEFSLTQKKE